MHFATFGESKSNDLLREGKILFEVRNPYPWPINFNWLSTPFYDLGKLLVEKDGQRIHLGLACKPRGDYLLRSDPKRHLQSLLPFQSISRGFNLKERINLESPGVYTIQWLPDVQSSSLLPLTLKTELRGAEDRFNEMQYTKLNYGAYFFPVSTLNPTNIITIEVF